MSDQTPQAGKKPSFIKHLWADREWRKRAIQFAAAIVALVLLGIVINVLNGDSDEEKYDEWSTQSKLQIAALTTVASQLDSCTKTYDFSCLRSKADDALSIAEAMQKLDPPPADYAPEVHDTWITMVTDIDSTYTATKKAFTTMDSADAGEAASKMRIMTEKIHEFGEARATFEATH